VNDGSVGNDGAALCLTPPSKTGDEADFCSVETTLYSQCGECEACHQTDLNNCVALGDALSATFKSALGDCASQIASCDDTTYAGNSCVSAKLATATPTAAQASTKLQYCTKCATDVTGCTTFFQPATDAGAAGIGLIVLLASDDVATSIASTCSSDCGADVYELCAVGQFCKTQAPDACPGSGFCK
jgi:hypothetical protein